jgi:cytochrome b
LIDHTMTHTTRVWDLPTRIFHWALVAAVIGLVISANVGGNAMVWHFRFGYTVFSLLLFRIVWGFIGGHYSRFGTFIFAPSSIMAYLQGRGEPEHGVGHNPLGAGSVFALLGFLMLQVASGLFSDDEIAFAGPLTKFASAARVGLATWYHKEVGKVVLIVLVLLHVAAIVFYLRKKRENLITPMLVGDKELGFAAPASRDDAKTRSVAAVVFAICCTVVAYVVGLGA